MSRPCLALCSCFMTMPCLGVREIVFDGFLLRYTGSINYSPLWVRKISALGNIFHARKCAYILYELLKEESSGYTETFISI